MVVVIEAAFPKLRRSEYRITSPAAESYNCIAWAAGDTSEWWWPGDPATTFWPEGISREETLDDFQEVFTKLGYAVCEDDTLESGFERVALFADPAGSPKHAARQLDTGRWTSKLGLLEDIEHALRDLEGAAYGSVAIFMKRKRS